MSGIVRRFPLIAALLMALLLAAACSTPHRRPLRPLLMERLRRPPRRLRRHGVCGNAGRIAAE